MVWNAGSSTLYKAVEQHNSKSTPPVTEERVSEEKKATPPPCRNRYSAPHECFHNAHQEPVPHIFRDKDMLLIAALLIMLIHKKADNKLILALAFVLLF